MEQGNPYDPPQSDLELDSDGEPLLTDEVLNPWISMWTKPRATIQQIVNNDPVKHVLSVAIVAGFYNGLGMAAARGLGDEMGLLRIFARATGSGLIYALLLLYLGGALLRWTGTWFGGQASTVNIRAAIAWSSIPMIWALLLYVPQIAIFGKELFASEMPIMDADPNMLYLYIGFAVIEFVIAIWALVAFLKCLGQVQGFSAWKALGNSVIAILVVMVPIVVIFFGVARMNA